MEEDFKNKLSSYIKENTGYLEELKVGNIFSEAGWDVRHSNYYLDRDEEKGREIDVCANKNIVFKDNLGEETYISLNLICEVKKSIKKPLKKNGLTLLRKKYKNKNAYPYISV